MVRIKTRKPPGLPAPTLQDSVVAPQCHYAIFRFPLRDPWSGTFHRGPEPAGILAVYAGVSVSDTPSDLYTELVAADHWFISKQPGRYMVVSSLFHMSFTFIVQHDGTYQQGWLGLPDLLVEEYKRGGRIL